MDPPVRVEATQRWIPPPNTNSDTDTGGSNVGHYFVPPKGPQTGLDTRKPSTSSYGQPPVSMRPPPTATQSDWAKHQQLFTVKLREWQTQVAVAEEELNRALDAAKNNEEIEKAMEKYHKRMKDLLRDRGGELDELEQSVSGSASSAHSEDDEEAPEGDEIAQVEEPEELWAASGFDYMELAMNGQESSDSEMEIPGSDDSSDAGDDENHAPPPTENDEDHRAAQRRINMQRLRGERALSHASARLSKLSPTTGTATPTRSRPTNIATFFHQSPTNSKMPSFPSPSDSATPIRAAFATNPAMPRPTPAAALPKGDPLLSRAKSPRARSDTLTPDRLLSKPPDNLNWRQDYDESLRRASQQEEGRRRHMQIQREQQVNILREIEAKRARGGSIGQSAGPPIGIHPRSSNVAVHQGTPPDRPVAPTSPPSPQGPIRSRHSQTHLQPPGQSASRASIPSAGSSSRAIPTSAPATQDTFHGSRTDREYTDEDDSDEDDTTESDRRRRPLRMRNTTGGVPIPNGKNQNQHQTPVERRSSNTPGVTIGTPTTPTPRSSFTPSLRPAASQASFASFNSMSSSTTASSARSSGAWSNTSTASSTGTFIHASEPPKSRRPSTSHPIGSVTTAGASGTNSLGRKTSMGPLSTTPPNPPHWHPAGVPNPMNASPQSAMSYAQTSGSLSRATTMPMPHQSASIPIPLANGPMSSRAPQRHTSLGGIFPGSSPSATISFSTSAGRDSSPLANMASSGANTTAEKSAWVSQPSPPIPSHTRPQGPVLQPPPLTRPPSSTPTPPISTPRGAPSTKLPSAQSHFLGSTPPQNGQAYARQAAASKKAQRRHDKEARMQARAQAKEEAQQREEARLAEEQRKAEQWALERQRREQKKRFDEAKLKETRDKEDMSRKTLGTEEKRLKDQRKKLASEETRLRQEEERLKKVQEMFEEHQRQFKEREDALDKKRLEHDLLIDERKKLEGCIQEAMEKEAECEREEEAERERLQRERERQQTLQDTSDSSPESMGEDEDEADLAFLPQDSPELESPNRRDAIHDHTPTRSAETVFPDEFFEAQRHQEQELRDLMSRRTRLEQVAAEASRRRRDESRIRQEQREVQEREERDAKAREERRRDEERERLKEQRARDEQRAREAREARIREEQRIRDEQRAQDEQHAREERIRQENERLNQQFQAKERRDHAAKGHPKRIAEVWEAYEENWRRLSSQASNSNFTLTFATMPWPVLNPPSEPDGITRKAISNFILSNYHSTSKTRKERLREALLKWHPDRFESRFLQKVPEGIERDRVREGVGNVIRCLNELTAAEAA